MNTRRDFLKKALYTAPLIMTVAVRPSFAAHGYQPPVGGGGSTGGGSAGTTDPPALRQRGGDKDPHDWWQFWRKL